MCVCPRREAQHTATTRECVCVCVCVCARASSRDFVDEISNDADCVSADAVEARAGERRERVCVCVCVCVCV